MRENTVDKIRVGIIGVRFGRHHVTTLSQMPDVQLVAVADRNPVLPEGLEAYARHYGARAYSDGIEMMERENLDAVSICISPRGREELIRHAARRGIPMIVEKPWATNLAHARRLAEICRAHNAIVMVAFSFRFLPAVSKLRALMDGKLGPGWLLNGEYVFRWLPPPDHWLWNPENGNGFFNENSCHLFDVVCYLMGRPLSVMAEGGIFMGSPSEEAAAIVVRFEGGGLAALTCGGLGSAAHLGFPRLDVVTRDGQAHLRGRHHIWESVTWELRDDECQHTFVTHPEALGRTRYADAMRHFIDCVKTGRQPTATIQDGVTAVALAMAVYESAHTGQKVTLAP
ncbi:MAG: Gfo/Idh/MocA family oxidoreductase [Chloroflexi bacterium]|nr:Gfo/Idh/MocA family oxidoreductase [Chloroflexota bacterium]